MLALALVGALKSFCITHAFPCIEQVSHDQRSLTRQKCSCLARSQASQFMNVATLSGPS